MPSESRTHPNTRYKTFKQSIFTAGDVDQFNSSRTRQSLKTKEPGLHHTGPATIETIKLDDLDSANRFKDLEVIPFIWSKFDDLDSRAVNNTFKYIFYKFKKGIFVRIANNELQTFLPFTNAHYKNEFENKIKVEPKWGSVQAFLDYVSKKGGYNKPQKHIALDEWVANNALVRYEEQRFEGDNNVVALESMFKTLCQSRNVPDIEFFVNRRDFPQLKVNGTEPYNHMFDSKHQPLLSHKYDKYSPILSGSTAKDYADVAFPTYEDWTRAVNQETGLVFPRSCRKYPKIESPPWKDKIEKAVFRGATTGAGVTPETNQRLKGHQLSERFPDLLDVGITSWNLRPRKFEGKPYLQTIERTSYPKAGSLSLQEQSRFKYILNLEGHVAAYRLSYEMSSGSVILLAQSQWKMWYQDLIKPFVHYVPVKEDLSDLIDQIKWCRAHDDECRQIAQNAKAFYDKFLGTAGILDFLQKMLWELEHATGTYDYLPDLLVWSVEDERRQLHQQLQFTDTRFDFDINSGPRCIGRLDGICQVMRSKKVHDLKWLTQLFRNVNGSIDLFNTNGCLVVGKKASHEAKSLEHVHEAYIGINAINTIVGKVPNFTYTFGPLQDEPDMVFSEFIKGVSFMDWLTSPQYNFGDFLKILVQLNLALASAQNMIGFIHYDLYPWNVMIEDIGGAVVSFDYFVNTKTVLTFETKKNMPIMIDFGKSRAVVFEPVPSTNGKSYGLVDHGFANLFKHSAIIDTLTLLYGSLAILTTNGRISSQEVDVLTQFAQSVGVRNHKDIKHNARFGALFDAHLSSARPKAFIDFVVTRFPKVFKDVLKMRKRDFHYTSEKGNPIQTMTLMKTGNENTAILEVIKHIDRTVAPVTTDEFFQQVANNMFQRRVEWFESEVAIKGDNEVKSMWSILKNKLMEHGQLRQPTPITFRPFMEYPKPRLVDLDIETTPTFIMNKTLDPHTDTNWALVWLLCVEAQLFDVVRETSDDFKSFTGINSFLFQNAIASNNTATKIRNLLL